MDRIAETMAEVQRDCEADAAGLDGRPFTGRVVAEQFGSTLAMLKTVARAVELLAASDAWAAARRSARDAVDLEAGRDRFARAYEAAKVTAEAGLRHAELLRMDTAEDEAARRLMVATLKEGLRLADELAAGRVARVGENGPELVPTVDGRRRCEQLAPHEPHVWVGGPDGGTWRCPGEYAPRREPLVAERPGDDEPARQKAWDRLHEHGFVARPPEAP